jgi:hypothetical protein
MEGKAYNNELLILNPLDGGRMKVLKQILKTEPLKDPRNDFSLNIIASSKNKLN